MDSDKLFIPDKWIHQFVLRTREYLFSGDADPAVDRVANGYGETMSSGQNESSTPIAREDL